MVTVDDGCTVAGRAGDIQVVGRAELRYDHVDLHLVHLRERARSTPLRTC